MDVAAGPVPVSIICVFNDPEVRRDCLDRSIEEHRGDSAVEYLPIDNVDGKYATAGAALNHGASLASHDYLAFVHQDVYLHSLRALQAAAGVLATDARIGVVGAMGIASSGGVVGRIRDRVMLLGEPAPEPIDVDSLDEMLFVIPRRLVEREPISEAPEFAWHAYAVEFGLRVKSLGLRVCALDIPLTHNSLTVNLERLDVAYGEIAACYPDDLPLCTPGGTIATPARWSPSTRLLRSHRWRYRWLGESLAVQAGRRAAGGGRCVLGDIRRDIDEVIAGERSRLLVVNVNAEPEFAAEDPDPLELARRGRRITMTSEPIPELIRRLGRPSAGISMLLTNLTLADIRSLATFLPEPRLLGFRREIGYWMLLGAAASAVPRPWRLAKARPLGMPALAP